MCQGSGIEAASDEIKRLGTEVVSIPGNTSNQPFVDQLREASRGVPIRGIILGDSEIYVRNLFFPSPCFLRRV